MLFLVIYFVADLKKYGRETFYFVYITALVFIPINYVFMLIESRLSTEHQYLFSKLENEDTAQYINKLCETKPKITTMMECYHMVTRRRHVSYTDSNGNTQYRTETYQEKVTTWIGSDTFRFNYWKDTSDKSAIPVCMPDQVLKVKLSRGIGFADDETSAEFKRQLMDFINRNKHRDVSYNYYTSYDIPRFQERIMCYDKNNKVPWWMNGWCFWFSSCLFCTWPFRLLLSRSTDKATFKISKLVSMSPFNAERVNVEFSPDCTVPQIAPSAPIMTSILPPYNVDQMPPPPLYLSVVQEGSEIHNIVQL